MKYVYACLIGKWENLSEDPDCVIGKDFQKPNDWLKEGSPIQSLINKTGESYDQLDYVMIHFKGVDYRINPIFIQIVTK